MTEAGTVREAMLLAGPKRSRETTSAADLLAPGVRFLNSDVVAVGLLQIGHPSAGLEIAAGRILLGELQASVAARESFCLETTLSGRGMARWIGDWREAGYRVRLVFVALDDPDLAVRRVAGRVADGGHDVPDVVVRRRWATGLRALFDVCLPAVDVWLMIDNSDGEGSPLAAGTRPSIPQVMDRPRRSRLARTAVRVGSLSASRYRRLGSRAWGASGTPSESRERMIWARKVAVRLYNALGELAIVRNCHDAER